MRFELLTAERASPKLAKTQAGGWLTAILYLAPHTAAGGGTVCPASTPACRAGCLVTSAGRVRFSPAILAARIRRTQWLQRDPAGFRAALDRDLAKLQRHAAKAGLRPAVRLNGGSDLAWGDVYAAHPGVQFWEYTKRLDLALATSLPNVHWTYSYMGSAVLARRALAAGVNVAVVFSTRRGRPLPATLDDRPVRDGNLSDRRWLDPRGVVVGLRATGDASRLETLPFGRGSFVVAAGGAQ